MTFDDMTDDDIKPSDAEHVNAAIQALGELAIRLDEMQTRYGEVATSAAVCATYVATLHHLRPELQKQVIDLAMEVCRRYDEHEAKVAEA